MRYIALFVSIATVLGVILIALLISEPNVTWREYSNTKFEYQLRYPSNWSIEIRDPQPGDDFEYQHIRLSHEAGIVLVAVNFQGGWCETGALTSREIAVSGVHGTEDICQIAGEEAPRSIVRYFPGAKGKRNYTVWS